MEHDVIPLIDLTAALETNSPHLHTVVDKIRQAATTSGFFYIQNHGIPTALVEQQFDLAKRLFALPEAVKRQYDQAKNPSHRGFEQIAAQQLDATVQPDLKEGFYCGLNYAADDPYVLAGYQNYGLNQWPSDEVPETEAYCQEYIAVMNQLCERIMQLLALSLGLDEHYFDASLVNPMVTLRLLKYPPHPENADPNTFGAGAHTDWGSITILAQDDCGGLEVCIPDGTWVEAPPIANTFVVNLGDLIPRWTNGLYKSNPHRVRNRYSQGKPRYSIPYFYGPSYFTKITALPGTLQEGQQYPDASCTAGEHMEEMYFKSFELHQKNKALFMETE